MMRAGLALACALLLAAACDSRPATEVVLDNQYAQGLPSMVVYAAHWQSVSFTQPLAPGQSSDAQAALPASDGSAYVVVAPGWDPGSAWPPTSFLLLQSRAGYGVHLGGTLHIAVDDTDFAGDCAAGDPLTQEQADFIAQLVFPCLFSGLRYDAATCTVAAIPDAGPEGACRE